MTYKYNILHYRKHDSKPNTIMCITSSPGHRRTNPNLITEDNCPVRITKGAMRITAFTLLYRVSLTESFSTTGSALFVKMPFIATNTLVMIPNAIPLIDSVPATCEGRRLREY